jgi:YggT family protein
LFLILELLAYALQIYLWIVLAWVIFTWLYQFNVINPRNQLVAAIGRFLYQVTEPVMRPIRRVVPNLGGIDISPLVLTLIIFLLLRLIYSLMLRIAM